MAIFFCRLGYHSLWSDELVTAEKVIHQSQAEIWNPRHANMEGKAVLGCMVPYYSLLKLWSSVAGASEAGLRSFSAASAIAAMALILRFGPGSWGLGPSTSLVAATLFLLSPMMLWYAQECRYYGLLQPLSLIVCGTYLEFWKTLRPTWLLAWVAAAIFAVMTHAYMIFLVGGGCFYGLWQWCRHRLCHAPLVITAHVLVAGYFLAVWRFLSASYERISTTEHAAYVLQTDDLMPWKVLSNFICGIYEHGPVPIATLLSLAAAALLILHLRASLPSPRADGQSEAGAPAAWLWIAAALGTGAMMIAVSWSLDNLVEGKRYVMVFFAPFCIWLALALTRPVLPRLLPVIFLIAMAMNNVLVDWNYFTNPQKQNWRLAGQAIREQARPGDVWIHQSVPRAFAAEYYGGSPKAPYLNVLWEPGDILKTPHPPEIRQAGRIWLVRTGGIAEAYAARLQEAGFRPTQPWVLPAGSHFSTHLWLFERSQP